MNREGLAVELELTLECRSDLEARSLALALSPDNKGVPKDQSFVTTQEGRSLNFRVSSDRASGALSTALSILSDAKLFQEVWALASSSPLSSGVPGGSRRQT